MKWRTATEWYAFNDCLCSYYPLSPSRFNFVMYLLVTRFRGSIHPSGSNAKNAA